MQVESTLVTVLMPVYNAEIYLEEAIRSVLNQSYQDFELLVINDGSTDGSLKCIKSFDDSRIKVLNIEQNVGLVNALNIGLEKINTRYIVRADADDICLSTRIEKQVMYMEQNKQVGLCGTWFDTIDETGFRVGGARYQSSHTAIQLKHLYQIHLSHGTAIFRTSVLKDNGIKYDNNFNHAEDYDMFDRISQVSELHNIQQSLYVVRLHNTNVSKTHSHVQKDNSLGVKRRVFTRLGVHDISDNEIFLYQELQHQSYISLANDQKEILLLLNRLFKANSLSVTFEKEYFRMHLSMLWFHYCNAIKPKNAWKVYNSAIFVKKTDLNLPQKFKFRIKEYLS